MSQYPNVFPAGGPFGQPPQQEQQNPYGQQQPGYPPAASAPPYGQQQPGYPPAAGASPYGQPSGGGAYPPPMGGASYPPPAGAAAPHMGSPYPGAYPGQTPSAAPGGYPGAASPYPQPAAHHGLAPAGYPGAPPKGSGAYPGAAQAAGAGFPGHQQPPQQHHAPAGAHGVPHGMAVVDASYCTPHQVTLKATEHAYSATGDDFAIMDAQTGAFVFKMDAKMMSMRDRRVLTDTSGRKACGLMRKPMSLSGGWLMYKGGDFTRKVCEIKPKMMTVKPYVYVFLNDGDKEPDFYAKGDFLSKSFDIYRKLPSGDKYIAKVKKESKFSSGQAYLHSAVHNKQAYFITAEPGADLAFLCALCICIDEIYHDQQT